MLERRLHIWLRVPKHEALPQWGRASELPPLRRGQGGTCAFRAISKPEGRRGCADALLSMTSFQTQTSLALGRSTSYDQVLDLATAGDPTADRIVSNAARAFGVLIAAVANIALPERMLLTGEGIRLAKLVGTAFRTASERTGIPRPPNWMSV
ncbi:MAG: ROK family protein [Isosphaeraceae bacterium]